MAINLAEKYSSLVDEKFTSVSKASLVTNRDYNFVGAHTIQIYSVGTAPMNDYGRNTAGTSRYGTVNDLSTTLQEVTMEKDRSFTFAVDKMDEDETLGALNAGSALARQLREVITPEVDTYTYAKISASAGKTVNEQTITATNAYQSLIAGSEFLDESEVPAEGRIAVVTPKFMTFLKSDPQAVLETEVGQDMRIKGVIANMDGLTIQKVPSKYLPTGTNFIIVHPVATTLAIKLAEYKIHNNPQGVSGALVEGRIYYTAFVRNNKKNAIYVSTTEAAE